MNEEQLSALVDDELDAADARSALDTLGTDDALRRAWGRYHLMGEALRAGRDPSARATVVPLPERRGRAMPVAGLAIAASVAALALALVLLPAGDDALDAPALADTAPPSAAALASAAAVQPQVRSLVPVEASREPAIAPAGAYDERLNGYLVNFNEQRSRLGVPGVHPYVRIVGFEAE